MEPRPRHADRAVAVVAFSLVAATPAFAGSPELLGGHLRLGGEVSLSTGVGDEGWFNDAEYGHSAIHLARLTMAAELRLGGHLAVLTDVSSENLGSPEAYALYVRARPWLEHDLDIQIGRIPPVFGVFARRRYGVENPLIGLPLVYQYLTTLRADAVPENADQLLENRGDGWRVAYPVGNPAPASGMPVVASVKWDTGAQARFGGGPVEVSLALTRGTLSSPQVRDTNGGRQLSGRVAVEPVVGLVMGVSAASGPYLSREVSSSLSPDLASREYRQRALGADAEWSRGHVIVRAEALFSEWDAPAVAPPFLESPLKVAGIFVEGRYKVAPNLYVAARGDHLAFTEIQGSGEILSWDAHVSRVEAGAGFALRRNLWLKGVYQYNWRDGGTVLRHGVLAGQLLFWF